MNFFQKLKQGVSEASTKAKNAVEINRIKIQISAKQKEIEEVYTRIGEYVFHAYQGIGKSTMTISDMLEQCCNEISQIKTEIRNLEFQIQEISNEKLCECGKVVPYESNFCSHCGHKFEPLLDSQMNEDAIIDLEKQPEEVEESYKEEVVELPVYFCPSCNEKVNGKDKFCGNCGYAF